MINTFIGLYNTKKSYLIFSLIVLVSIIFTVFVSGSKVTTLFNLIKSIREKENFLSQNRHKIEELKAMKKYSEELNKSMLESIDETKFLSDFTSIVNNSGNELVNLKPVSQKQYVGNLQDIEEYSVNVSVRGTYKNLMSLLMRIKLYNKLCKLEKAEMKTNNEKYPVLTLSFLLKVYPFLNIVKEKIQAEKIERDPFEPYSADKETIKTYVNKGELVLTGIINIRNKDTIAIVKRNVKSFIVKKGASIDGIIKVLDIYNDSVLILENNKKE